MENVNGLLATELSRAIEKMKTMDPKDPGYKSACEAVATLQRARLEEEKLQMEDRQHGDDLAFREMENEAASEVAKQEKKKFRIRTILDAAGVLIPAALYTYFGIKGFKFEQTGSFCSTTNRANFMNLFKFRK